MARFVSCSPTAIDADLATSQTPSPQLRWQTVTTPFEADKCWLLDAERAWFACPSSENTDLTLLQSAWPLLSDAEAQAAVAAVALATWHATSGFCGVCGALSQVTDGGWSRLCPVCHTQHFPRMDPAVIVALTDGDDRLLLGSQSTWGRRSSVFAGFVMAGESLEQAIHREVAEETGLAVTDIKYFGSQPWPFPRSLMLAFTAFVDNPEALHIDHNEIDRARWFTRDELRAAIAQGDLELPPSISIAHKMITGWFDR